MNSSHKIPTIAGILSIVFWSSTVGISRKTALDIGAVRSGFYIFLSGGIISLLITLLRGKVSDLLKLNKIYISICGFLFVLYMCSLYLAIGFARSSSAVIEVGIINYFWPALTLLFSVPILKNKLKLIIIPGMLTAIFGIIIATSGESLASLSTLSERMTHNSSAYLMAFTAAVSWALYSNFCRSLATDSNINAAPIFMLLSAVAFFVMMQFFEETITWTDATYINLSFLIIFPTILAYQFWEYCMKKGDIMLVTVISYLTPIFSTLATSLILSVIPGWHLWLGCFFVIFGAFLCKKGIIEPAKPDFHSSKNIIENTGQR
ncbi:MAG: aromatic amino acid DMT transporter YddG [Planctomycetota bacterium]|jgi:drug/metabolite transporter (DMT)-like permease